MIWCVEDDASIRDIEVYALRSTGFEACGFADGAAFWQALQTEWTAWSCCAGCGPRRPCAASR